MVRLMQILPINLSLCIPVSLACSGEGMAVRLNTLDVDQCDLNTTGRMMASFLSEYHETDLFLQ